MKNSLFGALLIVAVCISGCTSKATVSRTTTSSSSNASTMSAPDGLSVDGNGNVYAVSADKRNVQKFDSSGKLLAIWGSEGDGDGQFNAPRSISVDPYGNIFVVDDCMDGSVKKLDTSGKFVAKWKHQSDSTFVLPSFVAASPDGSVYVIVGIGDGIQKFDASGKFISMIGADGAGKVTMSNAIVIDAKGNLYVAEPGAAFFDRNGKMSGQSKSRIQKFDQSGKCIASIGEGANGDSKLETLSAIAVDSGGNIYVVEMNTVKKFDPSGKFLLKWGDMGHKQGDFSFAKSIAVDAKGNVYVGDSDNCRIQKFDSSGKYLTEWHMK